MIPQKALEYVETANPKLPQDTYGLLTGENISGPKNYQTQACLVEENKHKDNLTTTAYTSIPGVEEKEDGRYKKNFYNKKIFQGSQKSQDSRKSQKSQSSKKFANLDQTEVVQKKNQQLMIKGFSDKNVNSPIHLTYRKFIRSQPR